MGNAFLYGSSGGGLNFSVVGGTIQPAGKENLIWVNTSDEITGWVFSATEPTGAEGRVWFAIGMTSAVGFNAIKTNGLWTYPKACKQYISGTWVAKTAKTYQSGIWISWVSYLYYAGNEYTGITGGWSEYAFLNASSYPYATMTKGANTITLLSPNGYKQSSTATNNLVDLTNVATIKLHATQSVFYGDGYRQLAVMTSRTTGSNIVAQVGIYTAPSTISLDVSNIPDGSYYIAVLFNSQDTGNCTLTFDAIWSEV